MTGEAYAQSARVARDHGGPFAGYEANREPFLRVMRKHRDAVKDINPKHVPSDLYNAAKQAWDDAVELGEDSATATPRRRCWRRPGPSAS